MVFGIDPEALSLNRKALAPRAARGPLVPRAPDEVVLGSQVARLYRVTTGDTLPIRTKRFRVVGILEPTLTGPDSFVFMPFPAAQSLLLDSDPALRRLAMVPGANLLPIATAAAVFWNEDEDPEQVAERIRARLDSVSVLSPADATRRIDQVLAITNSLILGSALVALVVAALAVANTMFMAVVERRREIGLRRIVGATRGQVIGQLLTEAVALGIAGALAGLLGGGALVQLLNGLTERMGAPVFLLTPRLVIIATLMPGALAALAGAWPAWRAARLAPVEAVRYA
jgi:putative ABC transport system permease protein